MSLIIACSLLVSNHRIFCETEVPDNDGSFIERARSAGHATLVHCRVGVSRSATICIAEVMREMALSFPRA